jgi:hypothetical protein
MLLLLFSSGGKGLSSTRLGRREKKKQLWRTESSTNTAVYKQVTASDWSAVSLLVLCRDQNLLYTYMCVCRTTYLFTLQLTKIMVTTNTAQRSKMVTHVCCVYIHVTYCTLHTSNTVSITITLTPTYCSSTQKEQTKCETGRKWETVGKNKEFCKHCGAQSRNCDWRQRSKYVYWYCADQ